MSLYEMIQTRYGVEKEIHKLQSEKYHVEDEIKRLLISQGNMEYFTVNWNRLLKDQVNLKNQV